MVIKFKKLTEGGERLVRTKDTGAGYNLTVADVTTSVNQRGQVVIVYHSGIGVEIPSDYEGVLRPANDIASRTIRMCNPQRIVSGNIDDELVAEFITTTDVVPAIYNKGEVFAQLVINKKEEIDFDEVENKQSAATEPQSPLENEGEPTNSETAPEASGGEANVPEEA